MTRLRPRPPSLAHSTMPLLVLLLSLLALLSPSPALASPEGPKPDLAHTLFDNLPARIMYFDDSSVRTPLCSNYRRRRQSRVELRDEEGEGSRSTTRRGRGASSIGGSATSAAEGGGGAACSALGDGQRG